MLRTSEVPDNLKPFAFHSVDLSWAKGAKEATGACPWCGNDRFSVEVATGKWRCFWCAKGTEKGGGNVKTFIRMLHEQGYEHTSSYEALARDRKLLDPETLRRWGLAKSTITGEWLVPGYGPDGRLHQLYVYRKHKDRMVLLATPTLQHQLIGLPLYDKAKNTTYICEGPWDAMALWETLGMAKYTESGGMQVTASAGNSMLAAINVVAVPGCLVFREEWADLFPGHTVLVAFDNDHPRTHPRTQEKVEPGALHGQRRLIGMLSAANHPPEEIYHLRWGELGYNLDLPYGYDVRDALTMPHPALRQEEE